MYLNYLIKNSLKVVEIIKTSVLSFLMLILISSAYACEDLMDGIYLSKDILVCDDTYPILKGLVVNASGITIDCQGAVLVGDGNGYAFTLNDVSNVRIKDCIINGFLVGVACFFASVVGGDCVPVFCGFLHRRP